MRHHFPGNVRELENIIEHAFVLCKKGPILTRHLPAYLQDSKKAGHLLSDRCSLLEMETKMIHDALERNNWNKASAARELGIDKTTLWRKIKKFKEAGLLPPPIIPD